MHVRRCLKMLLTLAFVLGLGSAAHADTNFSPIAACEARSGTLRAVHPGTVENPSAESSSEVLCGFQRGGNTSSDGDDDVKIFYVDSRSDSAVSCLVAASTPDLATITSTSWRWSSSTPGGATSFTASYTGRGHLQFDDLNQPANSTLTARCFLPRTGDTPGSGISRITGIFLAH